MSWLEDPSVVAFETAKVDPARFDHREHLYVAFCYLKALPLERALPRYVHYLRQLTSALGVPHKFHATLTWAYLIVLHDLMRDPELSGADFDALLSQRPRLLDARGGILRDYYDAGELDSKRAREHFVLPRRPPSAAP